MKSNGIDFIDSAVCQNYLLQKFGDRDFSILAKRDKDEVKVFTTLIEFIESGTIQPRKEVTDFEGPIGQHMINYLAYKTSQRLAKHTVDEYEQHLFRFLNYLKKNKVESVSSVNQLHIIKYIKCIDPQKICLAHISIRTLRDFFKYLHDKEIIGTDLSSMMPKDNYKTQTKIPSTYSAEEVEKLIASIDRADAVGKRDYAVILLASRLALRASDIANLKFENIVWEQSLLRLTQYKTGRKIELPILPEVGNALIEYLKFGRPKSGEPFVFLCARSPFNSLHGSVITQIVQHTFAKTGINTQNRRHGPHALCAARHRPTP